MCEFYFSDYNPKVYSILYHVIYIYIFYINIHIYMFFNILFKMFNLSRMCSNFFNFSLLLNNIILFKKNLVYFYFYIKQNLLNHFLTKMLSRSTKKSLREQDDDDKPKTYVAHSSIKKYKNHFENF